MHKIALASACLVIVCTSQLRRSDLHLSESQRGTPEGMPFDATIVAGALMIITTVQIEMITGVVPPGTTPRNCTR